MSIRDPESWLPREGLSELECIQAADTMAHFCVMAVLSDEIDPKQRSEIIGSYFVASLYSCDPEQLEPTMRVDLERAGLESATAAELADQMNSNDFVTWAAACQFITEDKPAYGLCMNSRGKYVDVGRFVKAVLRLRNKG